MTEQTYHQDAEVVDQGHHMTEVGHRVVRASAGAGKTYALSSRYLRLVALGADPESILATTFTRKAAAEILGRVLTRLASAATDPDQALQLGSDLEIEGFATPTCGHLLQRIVQSMHKLSVSTIDGFFSQVLSSYRLELGLGRKIELVSGNDPMAVQLRQRAIDAVLGDEDLQTMIGLLRRIGQADASKGVSQLITKVVAGDLYETYRQNPASEPWTQLATGAHSLSKVRLAEQINQMGELSGDMPNKNWAKAHHAALEAAQQNDWHTFLDKGIAKALWHGEGMYYKIPVTEQVERVYQPLIEHAIAELITQLAHQTVATHGLLERFEHHYRRLRQEQGVLLYSDLSLVLHDWLEGADPDWLTDLYYRLDGRIHHLLLDEFQDTSVLQWDILKPIALEITAHADQERTFYCVGDIKQAIYGWRGGRAEVFDGLWEQLPLSRDAGRSLDHSYRTSSIILASVNQVFQSLPCNPALDSVRDHTSAWGARYSEQSAKFPDRPGYVCLMTSTIQDQDAGDQHDQYVADKIANIAGRTAGRSLGVLVGTNDQVRTLLLRLRDRGVVASGEGENKITDHPAVTTVLSALTLADHPGDTVAWFHLVNSPLSSIFTQGQPNPHARGLLSAEFGLRVRRDLASNGYAATITQWAQTLASSCDEQGVSRLLQLIDLADRYDPVGTLRPSDFVRFVESVTVQESAPAPVRVMTINKAKGLEFDAVVLPYLLRNFTRDSNTLVDVLTDSPLGSARAIYRRADKTTRALHPGLQEAHDQTQARSVGDELSKLYVAMTRARYALYMMIPPLARKQDGSVKADGWSAPSHAAILRHALTDAHVEEDIGGGQTLYEAGNAQWVNQIDPPQKSTSKDFDTIDKPTILAGKPTRSWRVVTPSKTESQRHIDVANILRLSKGKSDALTRGTIIHAWLAMVRWLSPGEDTIGEIGQSNLIKEAHRVAPTAEESTLEDLLSEFRQMIADPIAIQVLQKPSGHTAAQDIELWREQDFAVRRENDLLKGTFDRVVVWTSGGKPQRAELTDFKTDQFDPDNQNDSKSHYVGQIGAYRAALSQMLNLGESDIDAQLLFVGAAGCHRLPM